MSSKVKIALFSVIGIAALVGVVLLVQSGLFAQDKHDAGDKDEAEQGLPELVNVDQAWFKDKKADPGLKLTEENIKGLRLATAEVVPAKKRPLPPQVGTLNYDNDTMFLIKCRFNGELATIMQMVTETVKTKVVVNGYEKEVAKVVTRPLKVSELDKDGKVKPGIVARPIRFGDKVKQGDVLGVFWSQTLGVAKAALVDALCSLRLSEITFARQKKLFDDGSLALSALNQAERQVQTDSLAVLTAERTLRMWKLPDEEIKRLQDEAKMIHDTKAARSAALEAEKWARTEVTVPWFDKAHPERELTILEKNTNYGDIVDNTNFSTWLFRVADMSRLQIWVHPPEEFLPIIRTGMEENDGLTWKIRFQSDPDSPGIDLPVDQISPSIEPNQHNPMVVGYMPNKNYKYLAGQFVTATIQMPPQPDTMEIPTDALNEAKGQSFVFVKDKGKEREYSLRRVAVVRRYADYTVVRSGDKGVPGKLSELDKKFSDEEVKAGRYPLRTLERGEQVVTRGVVELTTALENLLTKESIKLQQ